MSIYHLRYTPSARSSRVVVVLVLLLFLYATLPWKDFRILPYSTTDGELKGHPQYRGHGVAPKEVGMVVASQTKDDNAWLQQQSAKWQTLIYVVDDESANLTVPLNKGREAMVYLTYIIDHYDILNDVTLFLHAQRYQWHNDDPDYDGQRMLSRLNISHVESQGYTNLRCGWHLGCPSELHPWKEAEEVLDVDSPRKAGKAYKQSFEELFPGHEVPEVVGSACCAQFAVTRDTIRRRTKQEYMMYRQWILDTDLADDVSGRIFEYSWHIIFGKDAVFCPGAQDCYCKLYGLCSLECESQGSCKDVYVLPPFSTLPQGWPHIGWEGEERQVHE